MILVLVGSFATSIFADRTFFIPNLPKQSYRFGVGVYEGVVAHSTTTLIYVKDQTQAILRFVN
ncbi:hypothetical protein MHH66_14335 [Bacillus sp. FSL H8-0492]|uniref:hypothetical protein n=1 Tax=Bacillus sp. FSL H8-0492 TaxID=2921392 RepID=UPI0009C58870|nr:hypothetical protein BLX04_26770 [Bacillus mycoides]